MKKTSDYSCGSGCAAVSNIPNSSESNFNLGYRSVFIILILWLILSITGAAQNFSYAFQKDSLVYTPLTEYHSLSSGQDWHSKTFGIHLPFQFNFCGTVTDSLIVGGNGFLIFEESKGLALVAFNTFASNADDLHGYPAALCYSVTGGEGNKSICIEFKNLSHDVFSAVDQLSYQIRLFENGNRIEVHVGNNSYATAGVVSPVLVGMINQNMDSVNNAYLINGSIATPAASLIAAGVELPYLDNIPSEGTVLKLTPTFN